MELKERETLLQTELDELLEDWEEVASFGSVSNIT